MDAPRTITAFAGTERIASGPLRETLIATRRHLDARGEGPVLFFDDETGKQLDFDLRGTPEEVADRAAPPPKPRGPGRPRLGVVSREVTLLPRHWDWLEAQPGGISATLRRLVDEARKHEPDAGRARRRQTAAGRFMWALAGDLPGFEEASRALYAGDREALEARLAPWPGDVRDHVLALLDRA